MKRKDPKKVRAGRKGGRISGANFRNNREAASAAGRKSAWARTSGKLEDFPLEYEDIPMVHTAVRRATRRAEKMRGAKKWVTRKHKK
jgi:hypothetical protein